MKFGENLKKLRVQANLSQEELSELVGVSRQSVSKWETSLAYPEMKHILVLCDIFHCQVTDLVHGDLVDVTSFSKDVQKWVVKFKKEEQARMKMLSKIIMILARIGRIACLVAIPVLLITMILSFWVMGHVDVLDNKFIFTGNQSHWSVEQEDSFRVIYNDEVVFEEKNEAFLTKMKDIIETTSKTTFLIYVEAGFFTLTIVVFLAMKLCHHLEKLFQNINQGRTPFTHENVMHLKTVAILMIFMIVLPNFCGFLFEFFLQMDLGVDYEMFDLIEILFLFSMIYIFQYGLEIQRDSNGIMYEESHE